MIGVKNGYSFYLNVYPLNVFNPPRLASRIPDDAIPKSFAACNELGYSLMNTPFLNADTFFLAAAILPKTEYACFMFSECVIHSRLDKVLSDLIPFL